MYKKRTRVAVPTVLAAKIMRPRRGEGASLGAPIRIHLGCLFLDARFRAVWIVTRAVRPDVVRVRPLDGERFVVVQVDLLLWKCPSDHLVGRRNRSGKENKGEKHPHKGHGEGFL